MKERFDVTGMTCSACSSHVEKSVGKLTGVENVSVNLLTNSMQVEFDENKLDTAGIIKFILIKFDLHTVCQQIHADIFHPGKLSHTFLHMG